jgi:hypothetical protein
LTITARPAPNAAPARLKVRRNIESLSAQELTDLRRAIRQAIALNDKRGLSISPAGMACHWDGASITTRFSCPGTGLICTGSSWPFSLRSRRDLALVGLVEDSAVRPEVTAGLNRQAADPDRNGHQRDPARRHVLDTGHAVVAVDVPAARSGLWSFAIDRGPAGGRNVTSALGLS